MTVLMGVAVVNDDGLVQLGRPGQLRLKGPPLHISRRQIAIVIQPDFTNGHHPLGLGQVAQFGQGSAIQIVWRRGGAFPRPHR